MELTEEEYNAVCVGDLCDIFTDQYNNIDLGIIINKNEAITENPSFISIDPNNKFLLKKEMMTYWQNVKHVQIPEPHYMFKIVHILGMSNGYWYPDSRIRKIYPNKITRKYLEMYLVTYQNSFMDITEYCCDVCGERYLDVKKGEKCQKCGKPFEIEG